MQYRKTGFSKPIRRGRQKNERGVALLTVLLLLILLTGLSVAMVMSVNSGVLINGYYRNFRGSFYAADSGLAIARQSMMAQIDTDSAGWTPGTTPPISLSEDSTIASSVTTNYGSWTSVTGSGTGDGANSWPESFHITSASVTPINLAITCSSNCNSTPAPIPATTSLVCTGSGSGNGFTCPFTTGPSNANSYTYYYSYNMTGQGKAQGSQAVTLNDAGYLVVSASQTPTKTNFSAYGMFIDQYGLCSGTLVPGTISGPVFTNGSWNFGSSGQYIFTDSVQQVGAQAGYQYSDGTCDKSSASSDTEKNTQNTIAPTFQNGFTVGANGGNKVALPGDSYSQEQAVIDSMGTSSFNPGGSNNHLQTIGGTSFGTSATGAPTGVYMNLTGSESSGTAQITGGGILVQGDASVTLTSGSGGAQQYQIVQGSGSSAVTTTITITPSTFPPTVYGAGTTVVTQQVGNGKVNSFPTIQNVPVVRDASGNITGNATMLYVNGNITGLSGPSSGAAVQDYTDVTVTASQNVVVTGNITYKTPPVDSSDNLTTNNGQSGVLGIFTAGTGCPTTGSTCGDIELQVPTSGQNLEIDASIASLSTNPPPAPSGASYQNGALINFGNSIGTLTILGGRIQNTIQNIGSSKRNVLFDKRFSNSSVSPPWFPSTTITPTNFTIARQVQRTSWFNASPTY